MMKLKTPRIRIPRPRKRVVIIVFGAILVIALGVYGFISYTVWRDLDQESKQVASSLKKAVDEALGVKKDTISPMTEMKKVISDFEKKYSETPCTVSALISWQTIIPPVKTITTECGERFNGALEMIASLKPLVSFIEHEEEASGLFTAAINATKTTTDYAVASTTWKTAAESAELTDTGVFQPVANKIKEVSTLIGAAFTSLDTALRNEDKAALDKAIEDLNNAYNAINDITTITNSERQTLILVIADAYDAL